MKDRFAVQVLGFSVLRELAGTWNGDDFAALLDAMEFGDTSGMGEGELREMCIMSLQDSSPEDAATLVIKHVLGDRLRSGQIRNIAGEMLEDKLWEQYADMSMHERMFNVASLVFAAFPGTFPEPDAVRVILEVGAMSEGARQTLSQPLHESFLVRLLADGMPDRSVLHRVFGTKLKGDSFPEADTIVWIAKTEALDCGSVKIDLVSSGYWLDPLRDTRTYESTAYAD